MTKNVREPLLKESYAGEVMTECTSGLDRRFARGKSIRVTGIHYDDDDVEERPSIWARLLAPLQRFWARLLLEMHFLTFPAKAGLVAALCSSLCFLPGPLSVMNKNGMWAVVTADVVLEANVGLTFSKGVNRTLGTMIAALLALFVNITGPKLGPVEPYYIVFCVFIGAALPTMFKFRRPFKDRWNYAVAMSVITFHILILSQSDYATKLKLPWLRVATILIGFVVASIVNMIVVPEYAGDTINDLVGKNFLRAGNVMERCVTAYREGVELDQVQDIHAGMSVDDDIHHSFHEIVAADSELDKLLKAVPWELGHGKFFYGYPWHMYTLITDNLRYTLYDVLALDSCLRAEIQAPGYLRDIFEKEFGCIGEECGEVFRLLGEGIIKMKLVHCQEQLERAQEGALILQHKIAKYTSTLIGNSECAISDIPGVHKREEDDSSFPFEKALDSYSQYPGGNSRMEHSDSNKSEEGKHKPKLRLEDGHEKFFERSESMRINRKTTVQRISALSLLKFAGILIELVAKAKYVVLLVEELEVKARFEECKEGNSAATTFKEADYQQV